MNFSGRTKLAIIFALLFIAIATLLIFIFFAGKASYTVVFDLDGGTLISGDLQQRVTRGENATPPVAAKDGQVFHSWDKSYKKVTGDLVIKAIWEYETSPGIIYADSENMNYTYITDSYKYLDGEVFIGAYHDEKKVLAVGENAFADRILITKVFLSKGLGSINSGAFSGCTALLEIEIPSTVNTIESGAFKGCAALETLVFNEGLVEIGEGAFEGCSSLKEIVLPSTLKKVSPDAFKGCSEELVITVLTTEDSDFSEWADGWEGNATVVYEDAEEYEPKKDSDTENSTAYASPSLAGGDAPKYSEAA